MAGGSQAGLAYETYLQFAQRMNAVQSKTVRFRPDLEAALLGLANAYRASQGVHRLAASPAMLQAARAHAMDMALHDFVGHRSSTNRDFDSRMRAFRPGQMFLPAMAENAARASNGQVQSLITQWIKSPPHRKALVSRSYVSVATAVVQNGGKLYAVEIFAGPEVQSNMNSGSPAKDLY